MIVVVGQARKDQLVLQSDCEPASHQFICHIIRDRATITRTVLCTFHSQKWDGAQIVSQIGECSTPSLSKRGCMPRGEMEDVSGGGAVRAKFLSKCLAPWVLNMALCLITMC